MSEEERQRILEEEIVGVEIRARDLFAGHWYEKFADVQRFAGATGRRRGGRDRYQGVSLCVE
jgi:hypothetical protein